jgi:hypothetical protein
MTVYFPAMINRMIGIHVFDPHAASPAAWADLHAFRRNRAEEDDPGEPVLEDADFEHNARRYWPLQQNNDGFLPNVSAVFANVHQGGSALSLLSDGFIDTSPILLLASPIILFVFLRRKRRSHRKLLYPSDSPTVK